MSLDHSSGREQFARVACIFVHDAGRYLLTAFEVRAGIEIVALTTGVKITVTFGARTSEGNRGRSRDST